MDPKLHMNTEGFRKNIHIWHGMLAVTLIVSYENRLDLNSGYKQRISSLETLNRLFGNFRHTGVDQKQM